MTLGMRVMLLLLKYFLALAVGPHSQGSLKEISEVFEIFETSK